MISVKVNTDLYMLSIIPVALSCKGSNVSVFWHLYYGCVHFSSGINQIATFVFLQAKYNKA